MALGNSGLASALDSIRPHLQDENPDIRRSAVAALREIPGTEVDELLATAAVKDPDAMVRYEAVRSMDPRDPAKPFLSAMYLAVSDEDVLRVRQAAVGLAMSPRWTPEAVRPILEYVAANEPNNHLREQATAKLGSMG